jgi:hypothetical protein
MALQWIALSSKKHFTENKILLDIYDPNFFVIGTYLPQKKKGGNFKYLISQDNLVISYTRLDYEIGEVIFSLKYCRIKN